MNKVRLSSIEKLKLKYDLCNYLQDAGGFATHPQAQNAMDKKGYTTGGTSAICDERNPWITYWIASPDFAEAVTELIADGLTHLEIVNPLIYLIDGKVPDLPVPSLRQMGHLIRNPEFTKKIDKPIWIPTIIMLGSTTLAELAKKEITPELLRAALDSSDDGVVRQDMFETLVSSKAGEPFDGDDEGKGGEDNGFAN